MKYIIKNFKFWFGILAILLVLGRILYPSIIVQNVLSFANLPLLIIINWLIPSVADPMPVGVAITNIEHIKMWLPYYFLFTITYIGYGAIIDLLIHKLNLK